MDNEVNSLVLKLAKKLDKKETKKPAKRVRKRDIVKGEFEKGKKKTKNLMNDFASELGMTNSNFVNPDGWDNEEQYTTAEDLIKLAEYVITVPKIMEITGTYQKYVTICSGESYSWTNSNLLIDPYSNYYCENAVGLKTGTTINAGNSLIAVFKVDGKM